MFIKVPKYFINFDGALGYCEEKFKLINTKYIISVGYMSREFENFQAHYVMVNTADGKNFKFEFLDKDEADKYIQMLTERTEMVIE